MCPYAVVNHVGKLQEVEVQRATPTEVAVMAEHAAAASAPTSTAMTPASVSQTVQPAVQANTSDTASRCDSGMAAPPLSPWAVTWLSYRLTGDY